MGKDLNGRNLGKGISQRKDGRYEARAIINGVKIDLYDTKLSNLKKVFDETKTKLTRQEMNERSDMTLKEWFDEWFETCKAPSLKTAQSTKAYKRKCYNTFIPILGDKQVHNITQINVQNATSDVLGNYSKKVTREALGVFRECFDVAVANHMLASNPVVGIRIRDDNEAPSQRRVLSQREQDIFLKEVEGDYYEEAYKILLLTGMRIGEFAGLQWNDIDWDNGYVNINRQMQTQYIDGKKVEALTTPKTSNSYRSIPFFNETEKLFKEWKAKQNIYKKKLGDRWRTPTEYGDLVFTSTLGSPVTRYVLAHDLNKVIDNINLKERVSSSRDNREPVYMDSISPHTFRHTFATRCFEKGLDPIFIQSIMGHSNYSTTLSYTHVLDETKKKELAKIEGDFLE